ncbi:MAG: SCO family protein [Bacteroidetes bacterium]|nr:SCO family protein [Bacteroidota bacterium]
MHRSTKFIFIYLLGLLLIGACGSVSETQKKVDTLPFYNSAEFTPEWIDKSSGEYNDIHKIAPFALLSQKSEVINNDFLRGKIYVADFFFTICPSLCPKLTGNMTLLQEEFKNDDEISLVSHTVMPWADSVAVLKSFGDKMGIDPDKWYLLTGDQKEIYQLARKSYFAELESGLNRSPDEFIHTENFILVDQQGRIRGIYNGTLRLEIKRIIEDIKLLKKSG